MLTLHTLQIAYRPYRDISPYKRHEKCVKMFQRYHRIPKSQDWIKQHKQKQKLPKTSFAESAERKETQVAFVSLYWKFCEYTIRAFVYSEDYYI